MGFLDKLKGKETKKDKPQTEATNANSSSESKSDPYDLNLDGVDRGYSAVVRRDKQGKSSGDWQLDGIGIVYHGGSIDEAIECFNKALRIDLEDQGAWLGRGYCLMSLGVYDKAIACFKEIIKLDPDVVADCCFAEAWNKMGQCYEAMGNEGEARNAYSKASEWGHTKDGDTYPEPYPGLDRSPLKKIPD